MGKYEIEMEITGFRLKIRGERDDVPVIKHNLQQQMAGLLDPATNIAQSRLPASTIEAEVVNGDGNGRQKKARRVRRASPPNGQTKSKPLDWQHDPGQFGVPRQNWPASKKIIWLLYVAFEQARASELSGPVIAETFNKHFRQAGQLNKQSMPRDLGLLKQKVPALVGDRAGASPITWFLTDEGLKEAHRLVVEARGEATPNR